MTETASGPEAEPPRVSRDADATSRSELQGALTPRRDDLRCSECGYGVVVAEAPPACPMCQASAWEAVARQTPDSEEESAETLAQTLRTQ